MTIVFVLIAGTLAAGAAALLVIPLLRARGDARPASLVTAGIVMFVLLVGAAGAYAVFSWASACKSARLFYPSCRWIKCM